MKYIVVSVYNNGCDFNVCKSGWFIDTIDAKTQKPCAELAMYQNHKSEDFRKWLKQTYEDYDLIIVCEDGDIEVLIDRTNKR